MGAVTQQKVDDVLLWALVRAAHAAERWVTAALADLELSPVQFGVLAQLAAGGPLTQAELARAVQVRPQTIAGVLDGMTARGLLRREGPRGKGRRNPLALSAEGRALLDRAWPVMAAANEPARLGLDEDEAALLGRLVGRLLARSNDEGPA